VSPSNLSEINPMESLGNATAPLDSLFKAIGDHMGGLDGIKSFLGGGSTQGQAKSSLMSVFSSRDTSDTGQAIGIIKSAVILVANILLVVLEVVTSILRGILGLIT